jgi:hypothetical protein
MKIKLFTCPSRCVDNWVPEVGTGFPPPPGGTGLRDAHRRKEIAQTEQSGLGQCCKARCVSKVDNCGVLYNY